MALTGEQKREYNREYMRKKRESEKQVEEFSGLAGEILGEIRRTNELLERLVESLSGSHRVLQDPVRPTPNGSYKTHADPPLGVLQDPVRPDDGVLQDPVRPDDGVLQDPTVDPVRPRVLQDPPAYKSSSLVRNLKNDDDENRNNTAQARVPARARKRTKAETVLEAAEPEPLCRYEEMLGDPNIAELAKLLGERNEAMGTEGWTRNLLRITNAQVPNKNLEDLQKAIRITLQTYDAQSKTQGIKSPTGWMLATFARTLKGI
jgi:hypothetical protein